MFLSTAHPGRRWSFVEAALQNVPGDGGLFLPADLGPQRDWDRLLALPWHKRNGVLLHRLTRAFDAPWWEALSREALNFPPQLVPVASQLYALELFHGPTLAFKDYGIGLLAAVLAKLEKRPRMVLCATSGDTGAAVARAFHRQPGFRVAILYPKQGVSPLQERQIASLGANVQAYGLDAPFDACQSLVKTAFSDAVLASELGLVSANSIHPVRLLAQVLYYVEAWALLRARTGKLVVSVPSGNFGNLCAGLLATRLGIPLTLVAATNANRTVPAYLESGDWHPRPSVSTLSNAMDISAPNNWERVAFLFSKNREALRSTLRWGSLTDVETLEELKRLKELGYLADPHGAVASGVLQQSLRAGETGVFLATAHPAKFRESLRAHLGWEVPLPSALAQIAVAPMHALPLSNGAEALRTALYDLAMESSLR
jgi:threonine synthase